MKKLMTIIILTAISISVYASNAGDWLEIAPDARAIGMGGAQVAGVNGAYAPFWNPASRSRLTEIGSTFALVHGQVGYQYLGAIHSFPFGKIGVGYMQVGLDGFYKTKMGLDDRPAINGDNFSVGNSALLLSYSENLGRLTGLTSSPLRAIDVGVTGKIVNQIIDHETASGFGLDIGLQCLLNQQLQLAAVAYNILPPSITWSTGTIEVYSPKLKLGLRYLPIENFLLTADADLVGFNKPGIHLGSEYWANPALALRAGYDKGSLAMGLGINYSGFKFDYAYSLPASGCLDATSRVSMGFIFSGLGSHTQLASTN